MGIRAADGPAAGERRAESVSDQPGSSCDPQFVVRRARSSIESEGKRRLNPHRPITRPPEIDRPHNAQEQVAHFERLCVQQALELDLLRSEVDVLKKALIRAGSIGQPQAGLACHATSWVALPPHAPHRAYDRFETQLPDLPESRKRTASRGT